MKLFEILNEPTTHLPTFQKEVGIKWVNVDYSVTKEERDMFSKSGVDTASMGIKTESGDYKVPVAYAYTLNMADNKDLMDAIKMRSSSHVMPEHAIQQMINDAIDAVFSTTPGAIPYIRGSQKTGLTQIQNMLKRGKQTIVVPLPSSSKLSSMVAHQLAQKSGSVVVDVFKKHHFPKQSKHTHTKSKGYTPTERTTPSPAELEELWTRELQQAQADMQRLEQRINDDTATAADLIKYEQAESKVNTLTQRLASYRFEKKKQYDPNDKGRGYYDYIRTIDSSSSQLRNAAVILTDDNIITGESVAEAIKALLREGIIPRYIVGFVVHKYYSKHQEGEIDH